MVHNGSLNYRTWGSAHEHRRLRFQSRTATEIVPVMTVGDLTKGAPAIEQAVKKYGH